MSTIEIHDIKPEDEYFVGSCTHTNESDEIDKSANKRP